MLTSCVLEIRLIVVPFKMKTSESLASFLSPMFQFSLPETMTVNVFGQRDFNQNLYIGDCSVIIFLDAMFISFNSCV